ncbi:MAG: amino acid permease [Candidatus Aenigmatarchaeota archaeon]
MKVRLKHRHHLEEKPHLTKSLGLLDMTMYGIGIIVGAGIYALIGEGAGLAGNAIWLSFIIGAFVAAFTGLSYCELNSMMPKDAAEYNYAKKAFNRKVGFVVGWMILVSSIVAASTVSLGFAGYFQAVFGQYGALAVALCAIAVFSVINFYGMKESSEFNIVATLIEVGGLVAVIAIGFMFFNPSTDMMMLTPSGMNGVMAGAVLMFFAFIGFESIANMSEEAKNPRRTVHKALLISLGISTLLYILVAFSAANVLGWETLSSSKAPLSLLLERAFGPLAGMLMSFIALFSTGNTILISLIVASRILYGMARDGSIPSLFSKVYARTSTPYVAVIASMVAAMLFLFIGDISFIANVTTVSILVAYAMVNLSLIVLRYKHPKDERPFKVPLNIGRFPVLAAIGLVTSLCMVLIADITIVLVDVALIALGFVIYTLYRKAVPEEKAHS